jgi:two-component system, OmpR family, sensor kinase
VIARLSLRTRLVLGVLLLSAIGLVAADLVTYTSLHSFLVERTDATLRDEHQAFEHQGEGDEGHAPPGVYSQVRAANGRTVLVPLSVGLFRGQKTPPAPLLPQTIGVPSHTNEGQDRVMYFTVGARHSGEQYRVRAAIEPELNDSMLIVAVSLHDVEGTLHRLLLIELLVTAAILAALAALGLWIVRLALRPLREIEATATAITAGDLSHRVDVENDRTEVGHVATALNTMLDRIEASDQRLRRFVADASHELRTPLAAVRAYAELFSRGAQSRPEDLKRSMAGITREAERMSVLVEDLLLLARLDEGRPLAREHVQLDELVDEAVETARAVDPERAIELESEPVAVLGDRDRLRQIVDNLLANVRLHTPPASPAHVSVGRQDGRAVIEVADSGPGLTADDLDRVFERFYRADESRSRANGGVGLGLSIVAAVARAHGGTVDVSSEAGNGATFRIELPAVS